MYVYEQANMKMAVHGKDSSSLFSLNFIGDVNCFMCKFTFSIYFTSLQGLGVQYPRLSILLKWGLT